MSEERDRTIVTQAYAAMLMLLTMMFVTDLVELSIGGNLARLAQDPGIPGLWTISVLACINIGAQLLAPWARRPATRWALVAVTAAYTLFFVGHQASHLLAGEGFDIHFLLDLSHHAAGLSATLAAYRLARRPAIA